MCTSGSRRRASETRSPGFEPGARTDQFWGPMLYTWWQDWGEEQGVVTASPEHASRP